MRLLVAVLLAVSAGPAAFGRGEMPATIQQVKTKHETRLMAMPGVVSVGIGRNADGQPVIVVGLDRERPETRATVPQELEGHPVRIEVIGPVRAQ